MIEIRSITIIIYLLSLGFIVLGFWVWNLNEKIKIAFNEIDFLRNKINGDKSL